MFRFDWRLSLYDLGSDPKESKNLGRHPDQQERIQQMQAAAELWRTQLEEQAIATNGSRELDAELQESLRALGYMD